MRRLRANIFAFLIFVTSTISAPQSLNPPINLASLEPPAMVTVPGWTYRGCYTDRVDSRTLTGKKWTGKLTPGRCASLCSGWKYFALESGNQLVICNDMCDTWLIGIDATVEIVSFLQASPFQIVFVPMFVLWMHVQHVEVRMCSACMRWTNLARVSNYSSRQIQRQTPRSQLHPNLLLRQGRPW